MSRQRLEEIPNDKFAEFCSLFRLLRVIYQDSALCVFPAYHDPTNSYPGPAYDPEIGGNMEVNVF